MKTIYTLFGLVVTILTVSCYRHDGLPSEARQPRAGGESQLQFSLEELNEALPIEQWQQFFEERGASSFWQILEGLNNGIQELRISFHLDELQKEGVANDVGAGIIRYLAYYYKDRVNSLGIEGSEGTKKLTLLDPAIGQLENLQELFLGYSQLRALPTEIGRLQKLQKLHLFFNHLQGLPAEIGQLKSLQKLYPFSNQLTEVPTEIGQLKSLIELDLSNNQLQALPTEIGQLKSLARFDLPNNRLQALPTEIGQLKSLTWLDLPDNQLQALPTEIGQLKSLTRLDLSNNQLQALPAEIGQLKSLARFDLPDNQLQALPTEIGQLKSLTRLDLSSNQLTCLSEKLYPLFQQGRVITNRNPWLQPANLRPEEPDSLAAKAYKYFPRSLCILCTLSVDALPLEQQQKLPPYFLEERRKDKWRECQWKEGQRVVCFEKKSPST